MNRILDVIYDILFYVCVAMLSAMTLVTVADVIGRNFNRPVPGANEIIGLMLVVVIACGVGFTQKQGQHIAVSVVTDTLPLQLRRIPVLMALLLGFGFAAFVVWRGVPFAAESMKFGEHTELLRFPWYPLKYLVVFGFSIWALQYLLDAGAQLLRLLKNSADDSITQNHETDIL
jgi:TRAP-type C4-dicarboxylate transport system permease small subunit